ncbi:MAG: hypothetical protein ACO3PR_11950, partial [Limisphaerales bacterium]
MQTLLPDPFDEGPEDDRIIRLARWASVMYPGKQFSLREIARLTGIPAQRLSEINLKMMERLDEALAQIRAVGKEGAGNQAATQAIQVLHAAPVSYLMEVLQGMKDASPIAQNWLRNAAEGLADQAMKGQADLPLLDLTAFVLDVNEDPSARALGFDFLRQVDDAAAMILLRGLINDPSNALRRQAIGQLMDQAKHALGEGRDQAARILLRQGIEHAREVEQIRWIADQLATLGAEI